MFLTNSETFDVSHRALFKIYTGGSNNMNNEFNYQCCGNTLISTYQIFFRQGIFR